MGEKMCIIARADMDETQIIDVIHPHDLTRYMVEAYKTLSDKLQARIDELGDRSRIVDEFKKFHEEGRYFGVEVTFSFDGADYPWTFRELYHYTIKKVWKSGKA